jgi:predicted nucleic acid-binding protein
MAELPLAGARAVVLDTNVALDLLVFDDPAVQPLRAALASSQLRWLSLPGMRDELARVLGYPRVAAQLLTRGLQAEHVLAAFDAATCVCEPVPTIAVRCSDPDDQPFLDLAAAHAALLLSKDHAVLDLRRPMAALGVEVRLSLPTEGKAPDAKA